MASHEGSSVSEKGIGRGLSGRAHENRLERDGFWMLWELWRILASAPSHVMRRQSIDAVLQWGSCRGMWCGMICLSWEASEWRGNIEGGGLVLYEKKNEEKDVEVGFCRGDANSWQIEP